MSDVVLGLRGIGKRYGEHEANRDARLSVERGTIHALVGENGAGKSTLLRIAYGELRAERGTITVGGRAVDPARWSPAHAIAAGLGMVHQHFMLVPTLTVVENVVLGREPRGAILRFDETIEELRALGGRLGLTVWPEAPVGALSVGEQQRVEIVKVLWRGADLLLLDEPTAVLSPPEARDLLRVLRALRDEGKTVVLCTHRLDEVAEVADRVTVMRRGEVVAELPRSECHVDTIVRAMLGREPAPPLPPPGPARGEVVLAVDQLTVPRPGAADAVAALSLELRAGEVLGIAGVEGNGQSELVLALAGLAKPRSGAIRLGGRDVTRASPAARAALGLGHVPEDRLLRGALPLMSVADNVLLGRQRELSRRGVIDGARVGELAARLCREFAVEPPAADARFGALSGGNQQKVVVARELTRPGLRALLLAQPTRGVDVGAAEAIRARIRAARDAGVAILLVSSDLQEVLALSDRVAVMRRGRFVDVLPREQAEAERLGELMVAAEAA